MGKSLIVLLILTLSDAAIVSHLRSAKNQVHQPSAEQSPDAAEQAAAAQRAASQAARDAVDYESWSVGVVVGIVAAIIIAVVAYKFMSSRGAAKEAAEDGAEKTEEAAPAAATATEPESAADDSQATDYQQLLKLLAQKVAQETGPKLSKAAAVRNVLESSMNSFTHKAKDFLLSEMNGTAGAVLRELDAPEAMMLLNFDHAVEANFPPASILVAGVLSPTILGLMSVHHIVQLVVVGLPILIMCCVALYTDWAAPCAIPTIFEWLFTQTALAALLVIGHGMLFISISSGRKRLAAKAEEVHAKHNDPNSVTDMRDQFVGNTLVLQEALLIESQIRHSFWNSIVGAATITWVITTIWNLVLICGWTFVPGIVAFHPKASHSEDYCGAWMTVLVLRVNVLLAVLFLFFNLGTVVQWVCDMMIENQKFQEAVIGQARAVDANGSGLPVCELLVKAFLLRGGADTLDSRLRVVQARKSTYEAEQADLNKQLAALDAEITSSKAEEDGLKATAKEQGGELAAQISKMEQQGMKVFDDVEARAEEIRVKTTKALEELYEKIQEAVDAVEHSESFQKLTKTISAKFQQLEELAEEAIAAAKDPEKQKELNRKAKEYMEKAKKAAEDMAAAAQDPEKLKELQEKAKQAMEEAKKAAHAAADGITDPQMQEKLKKAAMDAVDQAQQQAQEAVTKAKGAAEKAEKKAQEAVTKAKAAAEKTLEKDG